MSYKLIAPKEGRWTNYRVRGTEFGQYIDRTTGTSDKREAQRILAAWREEAKRSSVRGPIEHSPTFAEAMLSYVHADKERRFLAPLLSYFGEKSLNEIGQAEIDAAAVALYPNATAATRNRQVYSPMSAILRHAGVPLVLRRPKGSAGTPRTDFLTPSQAFALIEAAEQQSAEFGALIKFLLYTGVRLSEALRLKWDSVDLPRAIATIGRTKNGKPITVHLPPVVIAALANLSRREGSVFRLTKSGRLYTLMALAERGAKLQLPDRSAFHILRHTHATWRRLYAQQDTAALVGTGLWASRSAAAIYEHLDASVESRKADMLPTSTRAKSGNNQTK